MTKMVYQIRNILRARLLPIILLCSHTPVAGQVFEWVSTYKTEGASSGVSSIATDALGNVYHAGVFIGSVEIAGQLLTTAGFDQDAYIAKFDTDGNALWVRHLTGDRHQSIYAIAATNDNHIIATGSFQTTLSIDGFTLRQSPDHWDFSDTFVLKFNQSGTVVTALNIGFKEDNMADQGFGIAVDPSDNIYVAGGKGQKMFLIKTNKAGSELWRKTYGHASQVGSISAGPIATDKSGSIYMSGVSGTSGYLFKIDTNGITRWTQTFNGFIDDLKTDAADQLIVCGTLRSGSLLGGHLFDGSEGVIGKMNSSGSFTWHKSAEGFRPKNLSVSEYDQQIYFSGAITKNVAFGKITKVVDEASDGVIGAVSTSGFFSWVAKAGEENAEFGDQLETDKSGNIFIANRIRKDSIGIFQCEQKTGGSTRDIYVAKISPFIMVPIAGPPELCPDEEGVYSYTAVSEYIKYQWKLPTDQMQSAPVDDTSIKISTGISGLYEISIETPVDLDCENFLVNHTIPVIINPLAEAVSILGKDTVCAGAENVTFTVSNDIDSFDHYWTPPEQNATTASNSPSELVLNFSDTFERGEITYTLKGNCNSVVSKPFVVIARSAPGPANVIEGEKTICAGTSENVFSVPQIPNAEMYAWDISFDRTTQRQMKKGNTIAIDVPQKAMSATISVTGYNECGFAVSPPFVIEVKDKPLQPDRIAGPAHICKDEEVNLEAFTTEEVNAFHWLVRNSTGKLIMEELGSDPTLNFQFTGTVVASVATVNMCGESPPLDFPITEHTDPELTLEIVRDCDRLSHDEEHQLFWFKDGIPIGSEKSIKLEHAGEYVLSFIGKCTTVSTALTVKEDDISVFIPNVFTPNGDDKNEYFEVSSFLQGAALKVFNRWGKEVHASMNYTNNWNGESLPSGTYFYTLTSECSGKPLKGLVYISR